MERFVAVETVQLGTPTQKKNILLIREVPLHPAWCLLGIDWCENIQVKKLGTSGLEKVSC